MTEYIFNTNEGTLSGFPQEEDFPAHRANKRVSVMSSKEFKIISENYPHCDYLLSDVENIKHCRSDAFPTVFWEQSKLPLSPMMKTLSRPSAFIWARMRLFSSRTIRK